MEIKKMEQRIENLHRHVSEHPSDYEAVIAELIMRSDLIEKVRHDQAVERLKRVAEIRRRRNEKQGQ